jgi:signal recognition particle receptor subunit beta
MNNAVVLVFANKQDLPNALSVAEVTDRIGLRSISQRNWHVQGCCGISGQGLFEGLDWLSQTVSKRS